MSRITGIEWTDATWNPIRGCSRVSEGCRNCYAETVANRFCGPGSPYEGVVQIGEGGKGNGKWNGQIKFVEKHLLDPLRWGPVKTHTAECLVPTIVKWAKGQKPTCDCPTRSRRIFVNSMSDLFHENVTDEMRDKIFAVMALCPQHTFQVLTKRPERMLAYLTARREEGWTQGYVALYYGRPGRCFSQPNKLPWNQNAFDMPWPLPNVWLGVSVKNQKAADERIPLLLQTPAAVRFISAEPLLGPVELSRLVRTPGDEACGECGSEWARQDYINAHIYCHGGDDCHACGEALALGTLDWVIVGGESGPGARPMHPDWARGLRDQCVSAGVPFFFKQWGEWAPFATQARYAKDSVMPGGDEVIGGDCGGPSSLSSFRKDRCLAQWSDGRKLRTRVLNSDHAWGKEELLRQTYVGVGKKAAEHLLDGKEWHQMPEVTA